MNLLGDAALHQVRELIRQEQGRVSGNRADYEPKLTKGPEMFMAYSSTGIDAATEDEGIVTPEYATCDLFYRNQTTGQLLPLYVSGTTANQRAVYNANTSSIASGYFPLWRDKGGTWWTMPTGEASPINRQRIRLLWVDNSVNTVTTLSCNDPGYMKALAITGDWDDGTPFSHLTKTSGNDYSLKCEIAGDYLIHMWFNVNFGNWVVAPIGSDDLLIHAEIKLIWRRPPSASITVPAGNPYARNMLPYVHLWDNDNRGWFASSTLTETWEVGDEIRFNFQCANNSDSSGVPEYTLDGLTNRVVFVRLG